MHKSYLTEASVMHEAVYVELEQNLEVLKNSGISSLHV